MEPKQSVFIAASLDGFIARPDGDLDWLTADGSHQNGEDYGYDAFMSSVDTIVMGRNTFEKVLSFGEWPYNKNVVVLTSGSLNLPKHLTKQVSVMSGAPESVVEKLGDKGFEHLYIDGGNTIQRFLRSGLIQELILTHIPILIGTGLSLFGRLNHDIKLQHISTDTFENGFVQSRYQLNHPEK